MKKISLKLIQAVAIMSFIERPMAAQASETIPTLDTSLPIAKPINTDQEYIDGLYQQFKDVKEIFEKHSIEYWIEGGLLLGAFRHIGADGRGGFIPWDDDVDITLPPGEEEKLFLPAVRKEFADAGYFIDELPDVGYGVFFKDGRPNPVKVDIFTTVEKGGSYYFKHYYEELSETGEKIFIRRSGDQIFIQKDEVYPLVRRSFGPPEFGEVFCPNRPEEYLKWTYGSHWMTWAIQTHVHRDVKEFRVVRIEMDAEIRKPALPSRPLLNRIAE